MCEKFVYKHSETIEYVKKLAYFFRNSQTSRVNNSRILRIKNAKFSGYCFYMKTNLYGNFQICISVPLIQKMEKCNHGIYFCNWLLPKKKKTSQNLIF